MRILLQRVKQAEVKVAHEVVGSIGQGLLLFVGFTADDGIKERKAMAEKVLHLRIFADEQDKMNRSLIDVGGEILSVSQFTLYADYRKGRRPSYLQAAPPKMASEQYELWNTHLREQGIKVETGCFGAKMEVSLLNDGPVTILLDSKEVV